MMTIETYIDKHLKDASQAAVAEHLGIARCYLSQILNFKRSPGVGVQIKIYNATGQKVTPDSWLSRGANPVEVEEFVEP